MVEFMEWHVVRGAHQTIKKNLPLIWVENEAYFDDPAKSDFRQHHVLRSGLRL